MPINNRIPYPRDEEFDDFGRRIVRSPIPPVVMGGLPPLSGIPPVTGPPQMTALPPNPPPEMSPGESAYVDALRNYPQLQQPGKLSRILAGVAGGAEGYLTGSPSAGVKAAQDIMMTPYRGQVESYRNRVASLAPIAEMERGRRAEGLAERKTVVEEQGPDIARGRVAATREGIQARTAHEIVMEGLTRDKNKATAQNYEDVKQGRISELDFKKRQAQIDNDHAERTLESLQIHGREVITSAEKREGMRGATSRANTRAQIEGREGIAASNPVTRGRIEDLALEKILRGPNSWKYKDLVKDENGSAVIRPRYEIGDDPATVAAYNSLLAELKSMTGQGMEQGATSKYMGGKVTK